MGYEKAIETYKRLHEKISLEEVLSYWRDAGDIDMNVYVHSPFCASICKFCHYKGIKFSPEQDIQLYDKFYKDYLPNTIKPFLPILKNKTIGNYFFGGGTPSLMKPETMQEIFSLFPGFKDVTSKTFEVHPAIWSDEQLDVLAEYNFNCIIVGVQSFDENVLKRQNRIHASVERIAQLSEKVKNRGMYVAGDVIYHMDDMMLTTSLRKI